MINKYGLCPNCKTNWNGGDIRQTIGKLNLFYHKSDKELDEVAAKYGWTEFNKSNFTRVVTTTLEDGRILFTCPKITCSHIFDSVSEKEYDCMTNVLNNNFIVRKEEILKEEVTISIVKAVEEIPEFDNVEEFEKYLNW